MNNEIYITKQNAVRAANWLREKAARLSKDTFSITFDYKVLGAMPKEEFKIYNDYDRITADLWLSCCNFCEEIDKIIAKLEQLNKEKKGS